MPDLSGMEAKLRAIVDRFGLEALTLDEAAPADVGAAGGGRVLLVRWNRAELERRLRGAAAPSGARRPSDTVVPLVADGASMARLGRRPRRGASVPAPAAVPARGDLRLVSLAPGELDLTDLERTMLRLLVETIEARLAEREARPEPPPEKPLLSRRERECLEWTAAGKTTWEIAAILDISQNTIDGYIATATRKLGAVNRTQAVAEALRRRIIT